MANEFIIKNGFRSRGDSQITGSLTATSFVGDGSGLTDVLPTGVLSGSAQIASSISGSLGANATLIRSLTAVGISGSFIEPSSSFSTRVAANEVITARTLISGSAQIASPISGSFGAASASFSTRTTTLETIVTDQNKIFVWFNGLT
tara:strand:+ start:140 stop:580 length:441 start_codon:yes stop_codon:yes gene_type:complete